MPLPPLTSPGLLFAAWATRKKAPLLGLFCRRPSSKRYWLSPASSLIPPRRKREEEGQEEGEKLSSLPSHSLCLYSACKAHMLWRRTFLPTHLHPPAPRLPHACLPLQPSLPLYPERRDPSCPTSSLPTFLPFSQHGTHTHLGLSDTAIHVSAWPTPYKQTKEEEREGGRGKERGDSLFAATAGAARRLPASRQPLPHGYLTAHPTKRMTLANDHYMRTPKTRAKTLRAKRLLPPPLPLLSTAATFLPALHCHPPPHTRLAHAHAPTPRLGNTRHTTSRIQRRKKEGQLQPQPATGNWALHAHWEDKRPSSLSPHVLWPPNQEEKEKDEKATFCLALNGYLPSPSYLIYDMAHHSCRSTHALTAPSLQPCAFLALHTAHCTPRGGQVFTARHLLRLQALLFARLATDASLLTPGHLHKTMIGL